jgi:hypothetical protein
MRRFVLLLFATAALCVSAAFAADTIDVPVVDGEWWRIADDDPDVSPNRIVEDGTSNVCDFTVFKDVKGSWHLIACVRGTDAPGARVFHHWTSPDLHAKDWTQAGLMDWPRGKNHKGEPTSMQAPHCFVYDGTYYCFYNTGGAARAMTGPDGIHWTPLKNTEGSEKLFSMGRDVMIFHDEPSERWFAYYCGGRTGGKGHGIVARTSPVLAGPWSAEAVPVRIKGNPESPFVLRRAGRYYLFQQMSVFVSERPDRFEGEPLTHMTGLWYGGKYAPEVITDGEQQYLAGYSRGIWVAKLKWLSLRPEELRKHTEPIFEKIRKGRDELRKREEERRRKREQEKKRTR